MPAYQDVFKRYEKKYLLDKNQFHQFRMLISAYMEIDSYGTHTIGNLYYDTDQYDLIRTSLEKPLYKEKLRVRSYGIPDLETPVFIEIKKKYKGVVYKRRVQVPCAQAERYLSTQVFRGEKSQIFSEIDWFLNRYSPVPKVYIAYERTAYFGKDGLDLRITFDQNIRFRTEQLELSKGTYGRPLLENGTLLMEVKMPGVMPLWLSQILAQLAIYPSSYSKYGTCYQHYLINHVNPKGGIQYA